MQTIFKEWSGSTTEWESGRETSTGVEEEKEELLKQIRMLKSPRARRNNAANSSNVKAFRQFCQRLRGDGQRIEVLESKDQGQCF